MTLNEAYAIVNDNLPYQVGSFYGSRQGLALGAGLLYSNVRQPAFDNERRLFRTIRSAVYVVTHECDVEQENRRPFNDSVLICPIIRFDAFIESSQELSNLRGFLGDLANRRIFRALYVPGIDDAPYGGILYLNRISSTHVSSFSEDGVQCIGAVSHIGLREVDAALQNLLLREKSDLLTGMHR